MMLEVADLRAAYDRLEVLHGIDVAVPEGKIVAVIGANGAGKTTLLRVASGLLRPTGGRVVLDGADIGGKPAEKVAAAGLAHVPEGRLVFPTLDVDDNLTLGAWTRRGKGDVDTTRQQMYELFPRLAQRRAQQAGTLSGGEQQMLAIARGLMAKPKIAILDEPSVGLAPRIVAEIFNALARLRDEHGLTILLVEQNTRAAFKVADSVYVMDRGRVVMSGTPAGLADDERVQAAYLGGGYHASQAG